MSQNKTTFITLETDPYQLDDIIEEEDEPTVYSTVDSHQLRYQKMKAALVARINNPYFA